MDELNELKKIVCEICMVSERDISTKCRKRELVQARTLFIINAVKLYDNKSAIVQSVNLSLFEIENSKRRYKNEMQSNYLFRIMDDKIKTRICSR